MGAVGEGGERGGHREGEGGARKVSRGQGGCTVVGFALAAEIGADVGRASALGFAAAEAALGLALARALPRGEVARGEARGEAFSSLGRPSLDL